MKINVCSNKVLVSGIEKETKTGSGLILSKSSEDASNVKRGIVAAVGPGKRTEHGEFLKTLVNVGDQIVYQYGGKVEIGGVVYELIGEEDIVAVLLEADE